MPVDSQRVQSVFLAAVAADPPARAAVIDRECGPDADLRQRVEALLRAHDEPGSFLARPAAALGVTVDSQPGQDGGEPSGPQAPAETPGTHLGPYKLLQPIGEGGMGTVWMAEQTEPVRRLVALKVIRAGLDSAQAVARFEAERQALALMDHPNIARVLDAGTTAAGRPYFVMELVKGTPITRYCDEHRLTPRQRLELFVPVCQALQHAHQKGIIHRDIKPSNVLVAPYDGKPVVKVIDFGVAKATGQRLTERTMFTEFGAVIGTLEYMSPEQAELNNQDIDTRSDIYSLGVLLYELLTGTTPLDRARLKQAAFTELLRLIREEEPPRPSARLSASREALPSISAQRHTEPARLSKLVRGELDWIVMKALEKDRSRRYDTANGLARDVERYLREEPVEACPPSAAYRLRKFLRRNRGPAVAAALVVLALLGGIAGTTWGLVRASQALGAEAAERALAERERDDKEQARKAAEEHRGEAARARDHAESALYFNSVNLAHQYWLANNLTQSRRILDACPEGRRGWEWRYLDRLHHADLLTLPGIGGQFTVQFSKDGKRLALIADLGDTRVRTWDVAANRALAEIGLLQHQPPFACAALSPDGRTIALGDRAGAVGFYDADIGRLTREFARLPRWVSSLAFSPDGRWLAAARADGRNGEMLLPLAEPPRNEDLVVWEVASGKEVFHPKGYGFTAQFSPDGSRLLTFKKNTALRLTPTVPETFVALFDTAGWAEVAAGKLGTAQAVSFSGDGKRLALGGRDRQRNVLFVRVLDPATGDELLTLAPRAVGDVALSPDGATLAVTEGLGSTRIDVWDLKARRQVRTLRGHTNTVSAVAFAPDGRLASCSWDNTVKFWDPAADQEVRALARPSVAQASPAVFGPGGTLLAFGQEGTVSPFTGSVSSITLLDATTGGVTHTLAGHHGAPVALAFSRDGSRLSSGDRSGDVKVWDVATGAEVRTRHGPGGQVTALAVSADGRWVASAHEPKETARARETLQRTGKVEAPGKQVAAAIEVWDAETGRERTTLTGHPSGVTRLAFSPDGRLLASYGYPVVRIWDLAGGGPVRELDLKEYLFGINVLAFSPAGDLLATGGSRRAQLWDVASGRSVALFQGHGSDRIDGLALSPDETRLATASDREVKVWDATSGQEALTLPLPGSAAEKGPDVAALAWSADGQRLRAALRDASVVEWDATAKPAK